MIHSPRFTAVLDANVIYPAPIRDLLLNLADLEIFAPKWSEIIHEEWTRNLLVKRPDLSKSKLMRTVGIMNSAFPDAEVHGFEELIETLELPAINPPLFSASHKPSCCPSYSHKPSHRPSNAITYLTALEINLYFHFNLYFVPNGTSG